LTLFINNWKVLEPPKGPGTTQEPNICADFAHDQDGSAKAGYYRVGFSDLGILINNWKVLEDPKGPGIDPNCGGTLEPPPAP
jgi:hypothetical protein